MKNLKLVLWVVIIWFAETVFLRFIKIGGIAPDLLYMLVLCIAYREKEPKVYISMAALCGILAEAAGYQCVGFYLIIYICSVFAVAAIGELVYKKFFVLIMPIAGVFSFVSNSLYFVLNSNAMNGLTYTGALGTVVFPTLIYNIAVSVVILFLLDITVYRREITFGR